MLQFLIRRFLIGLVTLVLITFVVYALVRRMPGTPLTLELSERNPAHEISPAELKQLEKQYGLDKPVPLAYLIWIGNVARFDLGRSIPNNNRPVSELISEKIGPTLLLSSTSLVLAYLLSIPLGLGATVRSGKFDERAGSTLLYMLYSLPSFVAALYLQLLLAVKFDLLPIYGMVGDEYESLSPAGKAWDILQHMVLPVTCFTYGSLAYYTRFVKSNMEEVIRQDYIRTARAKGVSSFRVIIHHAFRNTLIPMVTMIGLTLPALLSGAIILERIFVWPGIGTLFFDSIHKRDYQTIMGLTLMFSVLTLAGQLLADILYAFVDPRVTYS